jgi:hyperosmotically inducible periplasmic protein
VPSEYGMLKINIMKINSARSIAILAIAGPLLAGNSLRASETDDRIEIAAKNSYVYRTFLKDDSVKTESKDGVVTLTGTVSQPFHKSLAQDTVENLPAVKSVNNQLKVSDESQAEMSDKWLVMKVKAALSFHRNVNASATEVTAEGGTVTLKGEASSIAQKELTTEYAQDVEGVKTVKNEMTVAETKAEPARTIAEKIDDASITAQIKGSLLAHRSTSALKTGIETRDGVVTVSGIASNPAEKSLVTKLINDIRGVVSVTNNMTIKDASPTEN